MKTFVSANRALEVSNFVDQFGKLAAAAHFGLSPNTIHVYYYQNRKNAGCYKSQNKEKVSRAQSDDSLIAEYQNCQKRMAEIKETLKARRDTLSEILKD